MNTQVQTGDRVTESVTDGPTFGDPSRLPRGSVAGLGQEANGHVVSGPEPSFPAPTTREALREGLEGLADDVLEKATVELGRAISAAQARFAVHVNELEHRGLPDYDHGLSTSGWLRRFCRMTVSEASTIVRTARAMIHMPTVTENALDGAIPQRSVQMLGRMRDNNADDFQDHESVFADIATYLSVNDLHDALSHWEQEVNYPKTLEDAEYRHEQRFVYMTPWIDGMSPIRGMLPPELFHVIHAAIESRVDRTWFDSDDQRTSGQRNADALAEICEFYASHNEEVTTSGGVKPHVTVTVDYDTLKGQTGRLPEIGGHGVTPETVRRIACDAGIIPMVLGSDSEPLDVGRKTRIVPTAMRRALDERDGGCTWTGCDAPVSWCDAHHIVHWADGGPTNLGNLRLLCRKHHTAIHNGQKPPPDT